MKPVLRGGSGTPATDGPVGANGQAPKRRRTSLQWVAAGWRFGIPRRERLQLVPYLPPKETVVEFPGMPSPVTRDDRQFLVRWAWYATPRRVVVAEVVAPAVGQRNRKWRKTGRWQVVSLDVYTLARSGVWRPRKFPWLPGGFGSLNAEGETGPRGPLAELHAQDRLAATWAILPVTAQQLVERLCPAARAEWADGVTLLKGPLRAKSQEEVRYVRAAGDSVVALSAKRPRRRPLLNTDASDAGPWEVVMVGGPHQGRERPLEVPSTSPHRRITTGAEIDRPGRHPDR